MRIRMPNTSYKSIEIPLAFNTVTIEESIVMFSSYGQRIPALAAQSAPEVFMHPLFGQS